MPQALNKPPYTRERPPLVAMPMQKRSPMAVYPPSNSMLVRRRSSWLCLLFTIRTHRAIGEATQINDAKKMLFPVHT